MSKVDELLLSQLKENLVKTLENNKYRKELVANIKELFREEINSERTFERIEDPQNLISILERRDCLNTTSINHILNLMENFNKMDNTYCDFKTNVSDQHFAPTFNTTVPSPTEKTAMCKKTKVCNLLKLEIGTDWKEFARNLSVRESDIDRFSLKYSNDVQVIIPEVMKLYEDITPSHSWHENLIKALEKCRRNKLKDKVLSIMVSA